MNKILAILSFIKDKLLKIIPVFATTGLGVIQTVVKFIKELLTLVINILFPIIPNQKFQAFVTWARAKIDVLDGFLVKAKEWLLKITGLV